MSEICGLFSQNIKPCKNTFFFWYRRRRMIILLQHQFFLCRFLVGCGQRRRMCPCLGPWHRQRRTHQRHCHCRTPFCLAGHKSQLFRYWSSTRPVPFRYPVNGVHIVNRIARTVVDRSLGKAIKLADKHHADKSQGYYYFFSLIFFFYSIWWLSWKQWGFDQLADDMANHDVAFLDAGSVGGRHGS